MSTTQETSILYRILAWVATILVPVALVLLAVRLLMSSAFLQFEYNTPNFPQDFYGFTKTDRLYWSKIAVNYLINDAGIEFLGDLKFEDGSPLYNARELSHMVDVKNTVSGALTVWYISLGLLAILGAWAWLGKWWGEYRRGISRGGLLTALLVGGMIVFVLISFGVLFVLFHNIFFAAGTWTFEYTDTLIRLFPQRFWRDIFILVGLFCLACGLGVYFAFRKRT
jgi:integral membrane protein (TIGR01906 family)